MKLNSRTTALASIALAALLLSGCGKQYRFGEPTGRETLYDMVWVEPQIIVSDSLVTLIRSDRIDSVRIDPKSDLNPKKASIDFQIDQPTCRVSVNLLDIRGILLRPLLVQDLVFGYYRMSFQPGRLREPALPPGSYILEVKYCDREHLSTFIHR